MARVADLYSVRRRAPAYQSRVVGRSRALTEQPVGARNHLGERQVQRQQTPKDRTQVRHQQRGRYALAGNVAYSEKDRFAIVENNQFAVIATDRTHRLIAELCVPALQRDIPGRQELRLDLCGQIKVLLMSHQLGLAKVVQAKSDQRILLQPVRLNRIATRLT